MSENQPFFPPPRPKGEVSYREPAARREAVDVASSSSTDATGAKKTIVRRPGEASLYVDGSAPVATTRSSADANDMESERTFWQRHSFLANYPRLSGGVLALIGGAIVLASLQTLRHGSYGDKATMFAPMMVCWGLLLLTAGYPTDQRGRKPAWWSASAFGATLLGVAGGIALLAALIH